MKQRYSSILFTALQLQSWIGDELINSKLVAREEKRNIRDIVKFADNMLKRFKVVNRKNIKLEDSKNYLEDEAAYMIDGSLILLSVPPEYRSDFLKQAHEFQQSAVEELSK